MTVVTEAMARLKQGSDEDIMEVLEKFPSALAFAYLLDQAIDKPKAQVDVNVDANRERELLERLDRGRQRVAEARKRALLESGLTTSLRSCCRSVRTGERPGSRHRRS